VSEVRSSRSKIETAAAEEEEAEEEEEAAATEEAKWTTNLDASE
jgi:hypothetical protein